MPVKVAVGVVVYVLVGVNVWVGVVVGVGVLNPHGQEGPLIVWASHVSPWLVVDAETEDDPLQLPAATATTIDPSFNSPSNINEKSLQLLGASAPFHITPEIWVIESHPMWQFDGEQLTT